MLYESNICTSVAGKLQACVNYVLVSLQQHHFDSNWNTDFQIKNEVG